MIHHVTYEIARRDLEQDGLKEFMAALELTEINPAETADWPIRWFMGPTSAYGRKCERCGAEAEFQGGLAIHLVGRNEVPLALGHFCVWVAEEQYERLKTSAWCTRNSGSGRIWLEAYGLRAEVRPRD